jgi:hypothetical protein
LMEYVYPDYGIDIGDKIFIEDLKCLRYGWFWCDCENKLVGKAKIQWIVGVQK